MSEYISQDLRQLVFERANGRCEYCLHSQPLSAEGRVTVKILRINEPARVAERQKLIQARLYK